jgi:hypothetical protein
MRFGPQTLTKQPDETSDWSRFKFYASLVKNLHFTLHRRQETSSSSFPRCLVHPDILDMLAESGLEKPVLPNLMALTWPSCEAHDRYIELFFGTRLTTLTYYFSSSRVFDFSWAQAFDSLRRSAPNLTSIYIYSHEYIHQGPQGLANAIADMIYGLKRITNLRCFSVRLNSDAIRHLATSTCAFLHLGNDATDILDSIRAMVPTTAFPELQRLVLRSDNMTSLVRVIELLRTESLRRIDLRYETQNWATRTDIEQLIKTLEARCSHTELTHFSIRDDETNSTPPLPMSILAPLLKFKNMTDLVIDNFAFDLNDDNMKTIAVAWPCLEHIRLCSILHRREVQPKISLASLVTLAQHCPKLREFELVLDIATVDFALLPPEGVLTPNRNVHEISLYHSVIGEAVSPAEIATFLSTLFPRLNEVCSLLSGGGGLSVILDIVTGLLPVNKSARRTT